MPFTLESVTDHEREQWTTVSVARLQQGDIILFRGENNPRVVTTRVQPAPTPPNDWQSYLSFFTRDLESSLPDGRRTLRANTSVPLRLDKRAYLTV